MEIETVGDQGPSLDMPPELGLKLLLNHEYPLQSKQNIKLRANQVVDMVPLSTRYLKYYMGRRLNKKKPIMDYINMISAQRMYGCPIGGIGGGTIGRGFRGEFCRFQLFPGIYEYVTVPECQFIINIRNAEKETIFQSVLSTYDKPKRAPASWEWNLNPADCEYTALYPRAWTTYDLAKYGIKLVCRQISPVIPHNYKDSSLPCAVFVFSAQNVCGEHRDVSITFTWTELLSAPNKKKSIAKLELERYAEDHTCGVTLEQKIADTPCTFTIAKRKADNETIHEGYCLWNSAKTSSYLWECLKEKGKLEPDPSLTPPAPGIEKDKNESDKKEKQKKVYKCDAMGLSSMISLDPGAVESTEFCLAWDMPVMKYKKDKKVHKRYYTKYFGSDGIAGASIAAYALRNYKNWEKQLAEWQNPIFTNSNIPDWLKSALMNELYFIADGGTLWLDGHDEFPEGDPRHDFGLFGYLEGHEYRMYNTYDVHFYASFALAQLWPNLQVVLQYMFRDTIAQESDKCRPSLYNGKTVKFKIKDSIPHDLGDPEGVPFLNINAYNIHDVSEWRDLNLKFILQVLRDYRLLRGHSAPFGTKRYRSMAFIDDVREEDDDLYTRSTGQEVTHDSISEVTTAEGAPVASVERPYVVGDILDLLYRNTAGETEGSGEQSEPVSPSAAVFAAERYLSDMYEACVALLRRAQLWDQDGDGLIENGGFPDQTYDAWVMVGPSAYCGGLWVASVNAVKTMARLLGREADEREFGKMLDQATRAYDEKLWNGSFYKFDTREKTKNTVMADQLAGHWYLRACGLHDTAFPAANVKKALATIYDNNVLKFNEGRLGAVNGYIVGDRGHVDTTAIQSEESWVGTTFGLAAVMIYEGYHRFQSANGEETAQKTPYTLATIYDNNVLKFNEGRLGAVNQYKVGDRGHVDTTAIVELRVMGMREEAFVTAGGLYKTLSQMGLAFETPEALYENGNHRSIAYMRPLAIWAIYQALVSAPPPHTNVMANGQVHNSKDNQL